jgi:hypothetical protein
VCSTYFFGGGIGKGGKRRGGVGKGRVADGNGNGNL